MHGYQYSRGIVANRPGRYHDVERLIPDFSIRADTKSYLKSTPYFSVSVNWHDVLGEFYKCIPYNYFSVDTRQDVVISRISTEIKLYISCTANLFRSETTDVVKTLLAFYCL